MRAAILFALVFAILSLLSPTELEAQPAYCHADGTPAGYGVMCINPWAPTANEPFELNFSSNSCYTNAPHEYQILRNGNAFDIYLVYRIGGCPGVPQAAATFTTVQEGVPAGDYTVSMYRLTVFDWPPPPFDPDDYEYRHSVNFTVLGQPALAEPVPLLGRIALFSFIALLLAMGAASLRLHRRTR